jgi:hypothetical protein
MISFRDDLQARWISSHKDAIEFLDFWLSNHDRKLGERWW